MNPVKTVASLFVIKPKQWGLRGDPYLWQEMGIYFQVVEMPASSQTLQTLIEAAFEAITHHPLSTKNNIYIERFAHGGMSSGHISPQFWRETAIPLLMTRYATINQHRN
jgi:hypothetical protein